MPIDKFGVYTPPVKTYEQMSKAEKITEIQAMIGGIRFGGDPRPYQSSFTIRWVLMALLDLVGRLPEDKNDPAD